VCFSSDKLSCIENASFIAVDSAKDIGRDRFSGIVGLSPFQGESSGLPSFISQGEDIFSFYLSKDSSKPGKIVLGGYDVDQYGKQGLTENDINWIELADDSWTVPMSSVSFKGGDEAIPIKSTQMLLDTGLSYSMAPQDDITIMETALKAHGIPCTESHNGGLDLYECECSKEAYAALPSLEATIGDKKVEIPKQALLR